MGSISKDARNAFFDNHIGNEEIIKPFLSGFDISSAYEKHVSNTTVYAYILKPEAHIKEGFGLEKDILLMYSPYEIMEPRSIQALDELFRMYPFSGRVDTLNCFILSDDDNVEEWIKESISIDSVRIIIPFSVNEIKENKQDPWYIRNKLRKYFFGLDLFGYTLPLNDDTYFFGRQQIVARYINSIKRGENRGVFGLRKTGKTSLLFKINRVVNEQHMGEVFFYDCKSPDCRMLHWNQLLYKIYLDICLRLRISAKTDDDGIIVVQNLRNAVKDAATKGKRIVIVFDEIEYISFIAPLDIHWKNEFVDFWQTIWSIQSDYRNLTFIVSGVNASVSEVDSIPVNGRKTQNPLFGIVQSEYLQGLSFEECNTMIKTLGKRMGLKFDYEAVEYIYKQYGGHPLLTRLACSKLNMHFEEDARPITITLSQVEQLLQEINAELVYYFRHVISELQDFYPDEYEMFEMLASGQIADYVELSQSVELTKHLNDYGLVEENNGMPKVKLPVAADFVAAELAKSENRKAKYKLIDPSQRANWILLRSKSIIQDMRQLELAIAQSSIQKPILFGNHSFPEADKLLEIPIADSNNAFVAFINTINRCFIEPIENYGKEISIRYYFWNEIKSAYPTLFDALYRAKVYRHSQDHKKLTPEFEKAYTESWLEDTCGFSSSKDKFFAVQQKLLDKLLVSIQVETNKLV